MTKCINCFNYHVPALFSTCEDVKLVKIINADMVRSCPNVWWHVMAISDVENRIKKVGFPGFSFQVLPDELPPCTRSTIYANFFARRRRQRRRPSEAPLLKSTHLCQDYFNSIYQLLLLSSSDFHLEANGINEISETRRTGENWIDDARNSRSWNGVLSTSFPIAKSVDCIWKWPTFHWRMAKVGETERFWFSSNGLFEWMETELHRRNERGVRHSNFFIIISFDKTLILGRKLDVSNWNFIFGISMIRKIRSIWQIQNSSTIYLFYQMIFW